MTKKKKWIILENDEVRINEISKKYNISPLIASVILNHGICEDDDIKSFLYKDEALLLNPFLLDGMREAVEYTKKAILSKNKIAVYGDYDVDGITSTFIIYDYLLSLGADVVYYIPDRASEGYGVNKEAILKLKDMGVKLIITVDVGITAVDETVFAKENGVDIIITDHHTPKDILPDAIAVINPKKSGDNYPNKELAGVGVAYKFVCALSNCSPDIEKKYSQYASIGTIADMVPLKGENRIIASYGLDVIKHTDNIGLNALIDASGIEKAQINSSNISFSLAPRLNAAGRISSAKMSVELFLEKDITKATQIAQSLDEANKQRQSEEQNILKEAEEIINNNRLYDDDVIVVAKEGWHHGVIGIVSSKITEKYYKPSTVISINDDGTSKASGRSIAGFNLFNALNECSDTLIKFGGHELAAGFSLEKSNITAFRKKINEYAKSIMTEDILTPKLIIDSIISPNDINCKLAEQISILEPFGIGNRTPVFGVTDAKVASVRQHKSGKHVFFTLEKNKIRFEAPAFNTNDDVHSISPGEILSAAGNLSTNTFRGIENVQFVIRDIKQDKCEIISDNDLRMIFIYIKRAISSNKYTISLTEMKAVLLASNVCLSMMQIKTALKIFDELQLINYEICADRLNVSKAEKYELKCPLENSDTYNDMKKGRDL